MKSGSKFFVRNLITAHPTHIHRYVLCDFLIKEFWHYLQFILFVLFPLLKKKSWYLFLYFYVKQKQNNISFLWNKIECDNCKKLA